MTTKSVARVALSGYRFFFAGLGGRIRQQKSQTTNKGIRMGIRKGNVIAASIEPASTRQPRTIRARPKKTKTSRIAAQKRITTADITPHAPVTASKGLSIWFPFIAIETESLAPNNTQPRKPTISTAKIIANFLVINCPFPRLNFITLYYISILSIPIKSNIKHRKCQ